MIDALKLIPENEYTIYTTQYNDHYDQLGLRVLRLPSPGAILLALIARRECFDDVEKVIAPIYSTLLLATRKPFAFTLHDLQERYYPENFTIAQNLWRRVVNKLLTRFAAAVICESTYVKSDIERFLSVEASRVFVITAPPVSGFTSEHLTPAAIESAKAELNLPPKYLFYPAQFFRHKNHLRLVEAFAIFNKRYPECYLLLTGEKQHEHSRVMARVDELGLSESIRHLGYVDADQLAAIYKLATMVVIPTLFESVSIPIFEAFTVGTSVCASNVVALPEQIGDAGVLFDPTSVADISDKITSTFEDPSLRRDLIARGKLRVAALSAHSYADQLDLLLKQLR